MIKPNITFDKEPAIWSRRMAPTTCKRPFRGHASHMGREASRRRAGRRQGQHAHCWRIRLQPMGSVAFSGPLAVGHVPQSSSASRFTASAARLPCRGGRPGVIPVYDHWSGSAWGLRSAWAIPRFSVPLGASLVLRAKPLHYMRRAVIAAAAWHVIFVVTAPFDRTGGFNEYARRRVTWARGAHQGSVFFPMPPICRFSKAPLPHSTAVFFCISLGD